MHVTVDFAVSPQKARAEWTLDCVRQFLRSAVEVTGLTPFGPEVVREAGDLLMGIQMIAKSHISLHLDRARGRGWADVFSCGDVSAGKVSKLIDDLFEAEQSVLALERGSLPQG
jgi:S-adenosylmethionine/arginine decarboxylase-like enzyme